MIILVVLLILYLMKTFVGLTFKTVAIAIDCCIVMIVSSYLLHPYSKQVATNQSSFLTTLVLGAVCVAIYLILMLALTRRLPRVSKVINFIIVFLGVSAIVPYFGSRAFSLSSELNITPDGPGGFVILQNPIANQILLVIIYLLITIPFYKKRMNILNSLAGSPSEYDSYEDYLEIKNDYEIEELAE